jgi:hypothetical protein
MTRRARTSSPDVAALAGSGATAGGGLFPAELFPAEGAAPVEAAGAGDHAGDTDHQRQGAGAPPDGGADPAADAAQHAAVSFDAARRLWPGIGLAIYALDPAGIVTLEVHADGEVYSFFADSAETALSLAFPQAPLADIFG